MGVDVRPRAIALMGPTASGKSALALEWAERLGGEIVSVDSALVYRGLDIGAAKPTRAERARAPHHLVDVRDPWQPYSAADFARDARTAIDGIVARGRMPILAGGTGLYFRALFDGLAPMPEADPALRARLAAEAQARGWPALHAELAQVDPDAAARIHATDPQRIQRALEVYRASGRPISAWQRERAGERLPLRVLRLVLAPAGRAVLHARIAARFDTMLGEGFLDEVRALRALP
ncbi:MAG TPA: tRNA (adenosine(37)-N6)-dimethylallyltransferase MiaA, partial [Xanthomonadaceae bacterium]|nr:tRNA (adenosine(37)-N6)-dimethylallyltransferase MiaA [Xanthomonadaceae bacterium]